LALDDDPVAAAVFDGNFSPRVLLSHRVESLFQGQLGSPLSMRENAARAKFAQVDFLVGGPPCQGHSDLNNHTRRHDVRNNLYLRMVRAAEVLEPNVVLIENEPAVMRASE